MEIISKQKEDATKSLSTKDIYCQIIIYPSINSNGSDNIHCLLTLGVASQISMNLKQ